MQILRLGLLQSSLGGPEFALKRLCLGFGSPYSFADLSCCPLEASQSHVICK